MAGMLTRYPDLARAVTSWLEQVTEKQEGGYIDFSDAARWYFADPDDDIVYSEIGKLTAPYSRCWMEFAVPRWGNTKFISASGATILCTEIPEELRDTMVPMCRGTEVLLTAVYGKTPEVAKILKNLRSEKHESVTNSTPRFSLFATIYQDTPSTRPEINMVSLHHILLDEDGNFPDMGNNSSAGEWNTGICPLLLHLYDKGKLTREEVERATNEPIGPFLFALSLMNCRNVVLEERSELPRQQRRRLARQGLNDIVYKTLVVKQLQKQIDKDIDNKDDKDKIKRRLHHVRAHWAHYSADAPLFGKYEGTFFRPQTIRGSRSVGEVVKTYKVKKE